MSTVTRNFKSIPPSILFEDQHLMVISKPAGLLSQGEHTGDENLVDWARAHVGRNYVGLIHRLDRNTSGVMVLAKRTKAAQRLTDQLQNGTLARTYRAWLLGDLPAKEMKWTHYLLKDERTNTVRVIDEPSGKSEARPKEAKIATLTVSKIATGQFEGRPLSLAEFSLETGRSHQIRVQASSEGYPLLGDVKYGAKENQALNFPRPALHSYLIRFQHPMSEAPQEFRDEMPEDMRSIKPFK